MNLHCAQKIPPKRGQISLASHSAKVFGGTRLGNLLKGSPAERRSLDLFRHAAKEIVVLTFDELLGKLKEIYRVMSARHADEGPAVIFTCTLLIALLNVAAISNASAIAAANKLGKKGLPRSSRSCQPGDSA